MEQVVVGDECFPIGAEETIVHNEEVVTSTETAPEPTQQAYNIPTMQVVTLRSLQPSQQPSLTNTLRNVRLIAIQPKIPFNGTSHGKSNLAAAAATNATATANAAATANTTAVTPTVTAAVAQPARTEKKVGVSSFYGKTKQAVKPSPSFYKEQQREREMKEFSHLNEEVMKGLRIFLDLTTSLHHSTTWPFTEEVDPIKDGAPDYLEVIEKPMWLNLIKENFKENRYKSISEFVSDMRLMFENCYRYNGPNHPVTKKALRFEQSLEQKLVLLPSDLRAQCTMVTFISFTQ